MNPALVDQLNEQIQGVVNPLLEAQRDAALAQQNALIARIDALVGQLPANPPQQVQHRPQLLI